MKKEIKITKEVIVSEVIKKYPKTSFVFMDYGLYCFSCPLAQDDTIEEAAKIHHLDLKFFLKDINKVVQKSSKK